MACRYGWNLVLQTHPYVLDEHAAGRTILRRWEIYELVGCPAISVQVTFHYPLTVTSILAQTIEANVWDSRRTYHQKLFGSTEDVMDRIFDWAESLVLDPLEQLGRIDTEET